MEAKSPGNIHKTKVLQVLGNGVGFLWGFEVVGEKVRQGFGSFRGAGGKSYHPGDGPLGFTSSQDVQPMAGVFLRGHVYGSQTTVV